MTVYVDDVRIPATVGTITANYAVTDNKRRQAIGAESVTAREAVRIIRRRDHQAATAVGTEASR